MDLGFGFKTLLPICRRTLTRHKRVSENSGYPYPFGECLFWGEQYLGGGGFEGVPQTHTQSLFASILKTQSQTSDPGASWQTTGGPFADLPSARGHAGCFLDPKPYSPTALWLARIQGSGLRFWGQLDTENPGGVRHAFLRSGKWVWNSVIPHAPAFRELPQMAAQAREVESETWGGANPRCWYSEPLVARPKRDFRS